MADVGGQDVGPGRRRSRRLDPVQTFVTQRRRSSCSPTGIAATAVVTTEIGGKGAKHPRQGP